MSEIIEIENTPRIRFLNRPGQPEGSDGVRREIGTFIDVDKERVFKFVIVFSNPLPFEVQNAMIRVFYEGEKVGIYQASESKRFETDIKRITTENPTGDVELAENELYNGLFNVIPDPIDGWKIETDNTGGGLKIAVKNARLHITSDGTGSFIIENFRTVLKNLIEYDTLLYISDVIGDADVSIAMGGSSGAARNAQGSYSEFIIAGGVDFTINGNINTPDAEIVIDFIIVNGN